MRMEKTMKHSDHWPLAGWDGEQRDFENNEKTRNILITGQITDYRLYIAP